MSLIEWAILSALIVGVSSFVYVWIRRLEMSLDRDDAKSPHQTRLEARPKPCYRCARESVVEYMGLPYCFMCREVVVATIGAVKHDPPYGFPGSPGYLDYPENVRDLVDDEKKKEESSE